MKRSIAITFLVLLTVACSDFFSRGTVDVGTGANSRGTVVLPDKATIDPQACEYGTFQSTDPRQQFLWRISSGVLCPRVREFRYYMTLLRLAADQSCLKDGGTNAETDLNYLWARTIASYEYLAANPFGPLQNEMRRLAMEIYAWPDFNRYSVKNEVIKARVQGDQYTMNLTPSRKGLASIELLIANPSMLMTPGPGAELKPAEAEFNALPERERKAARCTVLKAYLADAATYTEELYLAWSTSGGQYPRTVLARVQAGEAQVVLNELSDGLYYAEKIKDYKLGLPLGLSARCTEAKCPNSVEHLGTQQGIAALRANFEALKEALLGEPGFTVLLRAVNRSDLAEGLEARMNAVELTLRDVEGGPSLDQQVLALDKSVCVDASSPAAPCRLYFQMKDLIAFWKSEVLSALDLQQPKAESDGD